jgi:acylpyruvate hydrolase
MRFVRFVKEGVPGLAIARPGPVAGEASWHGLLEGDDGYPGSLDDLVAKGCEALASAGATLDGGRPIALDDVSFLPPLVRSSKILCVGLNYIDHIKESGHAVPDYPTVFARFASGLVAHEAPLVCPRASDAFDYEGELVAVIGAAGRHIPESEALQHVAGYSIFNDGSVRDYQLRTPQWTIGKNFDGTGSFGPYFVTPDELPAGAEGLSIQTRLNGVVVQSASTSDMVFSVARLVSLISAAMTLEPGVLIVTGTPAGVGAGHKPPLWMKAGDICEVEIEGIGTLRNGVVKEG